MGKSEGGKKTVILERIEIERGKRMGESGGRGLWMDLSCVAPERVTALSCADLTRH